ncbi:MAG: YlxR family protein [Dehalococcoidales bacterium]|nr:YlxR family protein [Dehalococcoidales bacterium]
MPATVKRAPQRTCLACRKVKAKRELLRLVRTPDGAIEIDPTGKKAGRGAYFCRLPECWEAGLKGNRLENALKSKLSNQEREQLLSQVKELLKGA